MILARRRRLFSPSSLLRCARSAPVRTNQRVECTSSETRRDRLIYAPSASADARAAGLRDNVLAIAGACRGKRFVGELEPQSWEKATTRWKSNFRAYCSESARRLHAIDATRARWRGDAGGTAASSSRNDLVKNRLVLHTANDLEPARQRACAPAWWKAPSLLCKFSSRATSPTPGTL